MQVPTSSLLGLWGLQFLTPFFSASAIERLRGRTAKTEAMAYLELHRLTGRRGRLRHIECLQAGE